MSDVMNMCEDTVLQLPICFPAFAIVLCGEPFVVIYDNGDGISHMYPPDNDRVKAAKAKAEKRFGANRTRWVDGIPPKRDRPERRKKPASA